MFDILETRARRAAGRLPSSTRHWAVRGVHEQSERLSVRDDVAEAPSRAYDQGVMVTVVDGGLGYSATGDTSEAGLAAAFERAHLLARASAGRTVIDYESITRPTAVVVTPVGQLGWVTTKSLILSAPTFPVFPDVETSLPNSPGSGDGGWIS